MIKMNEEKINNAILTLETLIDCCKEDWTYYNAQKEWEALEVFKQLQNNWNELKKLIDERIGDCRYFLANADVNYEKENMKKFMWLKEELQILKSKAQELEQGKDEN